MALTSGTRLGPYAITAQISVGGILTMDQSAALHAVDAPCRTPVSSAPDLIRI